MQYQKGHVPWSKGRHISDEHKHIISSINTGKVFSKEHREKLSKSHIGIPNNWKGKKHTEKSKDKMRLAQLGKKQSKETIEKRQKTMAMKHRFDIFEEPKIKIRNPYSEARNANISAYWKGRKRAPRSIEHSKKISLALKGRISNRKGVHLSDETKMKLSFSHIGKKCPKRYKGGRKASDARQKARRRLYGFNPLNEWFLGSEAHHLDTQHVIYIPKNLHRSISHSQKKPETMERINTKVFCWLLGIEVD